MVRRRADTVDGRLAAGEGGDLFVDTDGLVALWDWQADEVHPTAGAARRAWARVRAATWSHPDRERPWPPSGAAYDGIAFASATCNRRSRDLAVLVARDLADVTRFRRRDPSAAAEIGQHLDEYEAALRGMLAVVPDAA